LEPISWYPDALVSSGSTTSMSLYNKLHETAKSWVLSTSAVTPGTNEQDHAHVLSHLSPNAIIEWGHAHFLSSASHLQGSKTGQDFIDHLSKMTPMLETWTTEVADVSVDVEKKSAVVRADFYMQAKGDPEAVRNEILFWVYMDEQGEKVVKSTEFIDPTAAGALKVKMMASGRKDSKTDNAAE